MKNTETIMTALAGRRMMTLGNLAVALNCVWTQLIEALRDLERQSRVRVVSSQCGGGCSSCAGCDSESMPPVWSDRSIVISLVPEEA